MEFANRTMDTKRLAALIKTQALQLGFSAVGITDAQPLQEAGEKLSQWLAQEFHGGMDWMKHTEQVRVNPRSYFPQAQSIVVVAQNYFHQGDKIFLPADKGNISIYARGRDYHRVLRKKLRSLLKYIQGLEPSAQGRICVDSFPLMEKPIAVKAGIGWIGKHTNLIIKQKGSYFFLGEILLSIPLPADKPFSADYCGTCNRCQVACPTGALDTPYVLDARKCISYLTIEHDDEIDPDLQEGMGNWIFGCDICQAVCPWNRFRQTTTEEDFFGRFSESDFDLIRLAKLSGEEFEKMFAGTPVRRTGFRRFKRNVEIAIRNGKNHQRK